MTCGTVPSLSNNSGAQQEPHCLLERLKEALQKFTNLDLDSSEGQVILFYLFIFSIVTCLLYHPFKDTRYKHKTLLNLRRI